MLTDGGFRRAVQVTDDGQRPVGIQAYPLRSPGRLLARRLGRRPEATAAVPVDASELAKGHHWGVERVISRWGEHGARPEARPENDELFGSMVVEASIDVACTPLEAWRLATDITRIGEFSPECIGAAWIDGASGAEMGARFEGTNRIFDQATDTEYLWIRPCTVTAARPPKHFSYTVGDRYDGSPATQWDVLIEPSQVGCRLSQRFRHLSRRLSGLRHMADEDLARAEAIVNDRERGLLDGINQTLRTMKELLESTT
jgi:Polyketide cyclase / dehydrase and lipid transport